MAVTFARKSAWIHELAQIRADLDKLNRRKHELGRKLGAGTHRSLDIPGIKVCVTDGGPGYSISWKAIAEAIASATGRRTTEFLAGNRRKTYRKPSVSVSVDKAVRLNPDLKAVGS